MFNLTALASSVLDSLDNVAKDTLEEQPKVSATKLRKSRKIESTISNNTPELHSILERDRVDSSVKSQSSHDLLENTSLHGSNSLDQPSEDEDHNNSFNQNKSEGSSSGHSYQVLERVTPPSSYVDTFSVGDKTEDASSIISGGEGGSLSLSRNLSHLSLKLTSSAKKLLDTTTQSNLPPSSSATGIASSDDKKEIKELKKLVRNKGQEIETLNQECLELENQIQSLKEEVKEAWDQYKISQEKALFREQELMDEMNHMKNMKSQEKQNINIQFNTFQQQIDELTKVITMKENEKQQYIEQLTSFNHEKLQYQQEIQSLQLQLDQSKMNTISGVNTIRDELHSKNQLIEQMKLDHSNILRILQGKINHLEQENQSLNQTINDNHNQMTKLQNYVITLQQSASSGQLSASSADIQINDSLTTAPSDYLSRENYALNKEIIQLSNQLEEMNNKYNDLTQLYKTLEKDYKHQQFIKENENQHYHQTIDSLQQKLNQSEKERQNLQQQLNQVSTTSPSSSSIDVTGKSQQKHLETLINDYKSQVDHLSKMLLKKQSDVLELQTERTALRGRVQDLQQRCNRAEEQLASLRDVEEDGFDSPPPSYHQQEIVIEANSYNGGSSGGGLLQRRNGGGGSGSSATNRTTQKEATKVLSDLEKYGVKPGAGVSSAVTFLDSWALFTGRLLRVYPLARLGFVIYLLVLHLWVLLILVIQTHSLEIIDNPKDQLLN